MKRMKKDTLPLAVVVGGTSGIGAAIAQALQASGREVIATGATDGEVQRAVNDPAMQHVQVRQLNVRNNEAIESLFAELPRLDVLVNCAGVIRRGAELDPAVFAEVLDINLNGTMRCCTAARPLLAPSRGCIINTASMLSFFGGGLVPAYSASKGGVAQLTKSLAIAYAAEGIRVNAVAPGFIETPILATMPAKVIDEMRERVPLKRLGQPQDIARVYTFLASDQAAYINGAVIEVSGGLTV
jgi:NAD(P)-dependent dehydrogenase (short-subunit alcohol dehydrogenase family)